MKKIKKNNKGFSLVELIVVIAIMAVLVGVIAPTIMGNIERSRESRDIQTLDSIASACQVALTNEAASTVAFSGTYDVADGVDLSLILAATDRDNFALAVKQALGGASGAAVAMPEMEASETSATGSVILVRVTTNGQVTVWVEDSTGAVCDLPRNNTTATVTR